MSTVSKNIWLLIVLIVCIFSFHLCMVNKLDSKINELCHHTEKFIEYIEQDKIEMAKAEAENISSCWENYAPGLSLYIDHSDVESIGMTIDIMKSYFKSKTYFDTVTEANRVISKARDIIKREKLSIENIF